MEQQHRTQRPRRAPASGAVPQPRERATVRRPQRRSARPVPPVVLALRRLPAPRLTGLGAGLLAVLLMTAAGGLDRLLFDGTGTALGVLFFLVSAVCALWVRPADLGAAPVAAPIAFGAGVVVLTGAQPVGAFSALALHAGSLYGGTLLAALITLVRKGASLARRRWA